MPDFSSLFARPAGKTPKPKALPIELYPGIISSPPEYTETATQKIPCVRLQVRLTGWPDSIPQEYRYQEDGDGNQVAIDLTKRTFRRDMMTPLDLTDRAWYYLDRFLRSCGLDPDGHTYEELIPQLLGKPVKIQIQQYLNQETNEIGNQVGNVIGLEPV